MGVRSATVPKDSNTAFAAAFGAFGAFIALGLFLAGLGVFAEDGLSAGEVIGGLLLAVALGLLAAVQAFYANRWLRKRGQGIGEDEE